MATEPKPMSAERLKELQKRFGPSETTAGMNSCVYCARELLREVDRLRMFADWDENWIRCEGCQRWTQSQDMRTGDGEDGSCCLWCLKLDDLENQLAATGGNS